MRRYLLCAALSLCCCLPAGGAEPPIVVQEGQLFDLSSSLVEVQTGSGAKLFAPGTEESTAGVLCTATVQGTGHLWFVVGPGQTWIPVWATSDLAVFEPLVAGKYLIQLAVQQANGQWQQLYVRADIGGGPDPPPPPPPPPPSEELWGLLIHEANDTTFEEAKVISSVRLREVPKFTLQVYDQDTEDEDNEVPEDLAGWLKIIEDNDWALPHLLLVDSNGNLVAHQKPDTVDSTITFVQEHLK